MLNKKARFEYHILEEYTAGVVLLGSEVKSLRLGNASVEEAYCIFVDGEIFIRNMHIDPYLQAPQQHEPRRDRKLLLKKIEIQRISDKMIDKSLTLVPLAVHIDGLIKIKFGIGKGKKLYDKRQTIKDRDIARETREEI